MSNPVDAFAHSAIPSAPKEHQQGSDLTEVSSPSTTRPEIGKDLIPISQQLFQSSNRRSASASSTVDIDGKGEFTLSPPLLRTADE